ncbi:hypothetical protein TNIN_52881, partial [Trichonephila inaurata madagascariensis]
KPNLAVTEINTGKDVIKEFLQKYYHSSKS